MTETAELVMRPRGIGLNCLPCAWCGHQTDHVQADMASFVRDRATGEAVVELFAQCQLTASLDTRRASEGRFQVKVGACGQHEPNLRMLELLIWFDRTEPRPLTAELLIQTIPRPKRSALEDITDVASALETLARRGSEHPLGQAYVESMVESLRRSVLRLGS